VREARARSERHVKKRAVANPFLGGFQVDFECGYVEVVPGGIFNRPACLFRGGLWILRLQIFQDQPLLRGLSCTFLSWIVGLHDRSLIIALSLRNDTGPSVKGARLI
jgi:hypothetical protein